MQVKGTQIVISAEGIEILPDDTGLWFDRYKDYDSRWGIKLAWVKGYVLRPVGKLYKWLIGREMPNPWTSGDHWFVMGPWYFQGPFVSFAFGKHRFYFGLKVYELDRKDRRWGWKYAFGQYLCPSLRG